MHAELCQHMPGCGAVAWPAGPAAALLSTLNSVMHTVHVSALLSDAPHPLFTAMCHVRAIACDQDRGCVHKLPAKVLLYGRVVTAAARALRRAASAHDMGQPPLFNQDRPASAFRPGRAAGTRAAGGAGSATATARA